jgi:hypothetical protein
MHGSDGPGGDQVIDEHVHVDEQALGKQHEGCLRGRTDLTAA